MAWAATFDPFEALGIERDATPRSIKARYHELARRYHPNRNQGSDESKRALSEHFYHVYQAWQILSEADKRRRCIEILELFDQQEAVIASVADLFGSNEQTDQHLDHRTPAPDGHVSSDADDDDLPRVTGLRRRTTFDRPAKRFTGGLDDIDERSGTIEHAVDKDRQARSRKSRLRGKARSDKEDGSSDNNTATERRRKFDKLRRQELEAFKKYRDGMWAKFEAEAAAEKYKEQFEYAKWRREYFERAPRDTNQRVRLIQLFNTATKAFSTQKPGKRRNRSTVSFAGPLLTPVEPLETNQFLNLPSRAKSINKRGYSSDISGDQTSSDEYSSEKATSPSRSPGLSSPRQTPRKHRRWDSLPSVVPIAPHGLPNGNHEPISPISGPGPKVLVRKPTNFNDMFNAHASDVDSASASSRSPAPHPPKLEPNKFVLVPTKGLSEALGCSRERSAGSDRRASSRNGGASGTHGPSSEPYLFQIKQVGHLQYRNIPMDHVHELTHIEKQWMLGVEPDADMDPDTLLDGIARLDQNVASLFMVKPDIKASFKFRLVYSHREIVKHQHRTFIALSYRRKLHVEKKRQNGHSHYTLPLVPGMFQAVWDERVLDTEGVWIDQICIDNDSEEEKTISMSAMDMVYRSARLVVVALDDIELEAHEAHILENHMAEFERQVHVPPNKRFRRRQTPYLESHEDLFMVIRKMMRSSWFRRAWCRHEMRLAREHIFLVPSTEVPFEAAIEQVKPALYAFFRDRSKLAAHEHHLHKHHGNFTTVVAEVFAMEAGGDPRIPEEQRAADARKDKISIILNTMECGLALQPRVRNPKIPLPTHECNYLLLLLALAAHDPGALGSVGHPLSQLPYGLTSSWLFEPTNVDAGLNNYRTLNRLPEMQITTHYQKSEHFVQLALNFMETGRVQCPRDFPDTIALAQHFLDICKNRKLGRNRNRYLVDNSTANHLFGSMEDVYVETLVCVLECGPDWMSDVCERYGVSRWRNDLQPAVELLIAFKNTNGRWPETAWSNQAVGFVADFVNFLIIRGMPQRQITEPEEWRPVWVDTMAGGKVLTFAPPGDIRVAVPSALLDSDYVHLARLWVLQPRGELDYENLSRYNEWTLLGKSVLFSDDVSNELLEVNNTMIREKQKVFGRSKPPQSGLRLHVPGR